MEHRRVALLLPGQGAQRERMAAGLYRPGSVFAAHMDAFLTALGTEGGKLRAQWLRPAPNPVLDDALVAQPLLFAVGHALGRVVRSWNAGPGVLLGHSAGELAAACLAGVFDERAAATLLAARSHALTGTGGGGMLAAAAALEQVTGLLAGLPDGRAAVAAVNGPRQTVLAGPVEALARAEARLRAAGVVVRPLRSGHAFHSPEMRPAAARFEKYVARVRLLPPRTELWSARTARPVDERQAREPAFWAGQLALPVLYWPALRALLDAHARGPGLVLLDASADRSLSAPARRHPAVRSGTCVVVPLLPGRTAGTVEDEETLDAARERLAGEGLLA
ncbi:hypothetical protein GCM10023084_24370 [Streptomyces lacrimifluminis]|uniref:Malonyl-CoA:ACP transacylase (MAT) domain-containing protein n=1 Tax=Streptomyces lacrimifluminis TaxID=1500077 RepID=A0A917KK02_9ACTN|nr:acyltransferase domain-containing protein [Streptomyces lacrimifluminis]GGJ14819.1 hypothetical protein GCM10012282_08890 [Streptomyces lacrimifluminis]